MNAVTHGEFARLEVPGLGALGAIEVRLSVEVGAARLTLDALMALERGTVLELDRHCDEPISILVNDRLFAKGEIVTLGDRFGVRIIELVALPS